MPTDVLSLAKAAVNGTAAVVIPGDDYFDTPAACVVSTGTAVIVLNDDDNSEPVEVLHARNEKLRSNASTKVAVPVVAVTASNRTNPQCPTLMTATEIRTRLNTAVNAGNSEAETHAEALRQWWVISSQGLTYEEIEAAKASEERSKAKKAATVALAALGFRLFGIVFPDQYNSVVSPFWSLVGFLWPF